MIKAIETEYNGHPMRSRLEAKWAMAFDLLGLTWQYEPEAFITSKGKYSPDFYIDNIGWVEIKPKNFINDERHYAFAAGLEEKEYFYVIRGEPGFPNLNNDGFYYATMLSIGYDEPYLFCECPTCGVIGIQYDGRSARNKHKENCEILRLRQQGLSHPIYGRTDDKVYNFDSERIIKAFDTARTHRFWTPK